MVLASIGACYGLFLLDVPVARFVRSLQHPLGYLLNPWFAQWSVWGDWLGGGTQLVALSLLLWSVGKLSGWRSYELAGLQSLWAHALSGILANALKRALGRPRPKFSHAGEFQLWPSMDNGFDSFPSGHASASFAVATVLAVRFPRARGACYAVAAAVSCSRVLRSSHFPTDVVVGAALGMAVGWVVSFPLRWWRRSLAGAVREWTPWLVVLFATLWVASGPLERDPATTGLFIAGGVVASLGAVVRIWGERVLSRWQKWNGPRLAQYLVGGGFAIATGSMPVMILGGSVLLGYWITTRSADRTIGLAADPGPWARVLSDAIVGAGVLLGLALIWMLPGLFPVR